MPNEISGMGEQPLQISTRAHQAGLSSIRGTTIPTSQTREAAMPRMMGNSSPTEKLCGKVAEHTSDSSHARICRNATDTLPKPKLQTFRGLLFTRSVSLYPFLNGPRQIRSFHSQNQRCDYGVHETQLASSEFRIRT